MISIFPPIPQTLYRQSCASSCTPSTTPGNIVTCCQTDNCNTFTASTLPPAIVTSCYSGGSISYNNVLNFTAEIKPVATVAPKNQFCKIYRRFDLTTTPTISQEVIYFSSSICVPEVLINGKYAELLVSCCQTNNCNIPSSTIHSHQLELHLLPLMMFFLVHIKI